MIEQADAVPYQGELPGDHSVNEFLSHYADRLAIQPWLGNELAILKQVTLAREANDWYVRDEAGNGLRLAGSPPWRMLAETGGNPTEIVLEWNGETGNLLSFMQMGHLVLSPS